MYDKVAPDLPRVPRPNLPNFRRPEPPPPPLRPRGWRGWSRGKKALVSGGLAFVVFIGFVSCLGTGANDNGPSAVPNLVGLDLVTAKARLEPAWDGISADATGQGRMQIIDEHWHVVRQDPVGGTALALGRPVTLYVVKPGEADAGPVGAAAGSTAAP